MMAIKKMENNIKRNKKQTFKKQQENGQMAIFVTQKSGGAWSYRMMQKVAIEK